MTLRDFDLEHKKNQFQFQMNETTNAKTTPLHSKLFPFAKQLKSSKNDQIVLMHYLVSNDHNSNLVAMASFGFIAPLNLGPPLIYLVRLLAITDPHINICVRPPNTCVALKQFNLLSPLHIVLKQFHLLPPNPSV